MSFYEKFNPTTKRVVETFSGDALDTDRWSFRQPRGSPNNSYAMSDSIDGGLVLTTGSSSWDGGSITFGDKRQYSPTGSVIIQVTKLTDPTTSGIEAGFSDHQDGANIASAADGASMENSYQNSYIRLGTAQTGYYTWATSTIARTSDWITSKVELKTASCELSINGVYATTVTDTLPTGKSQPIFIPFTNSGVKTASIRYCEAYNT
jgi:hypothetical protein